VGHLSFRRLGVTTWHGFASRIVAAQAPLTGRAPRVTPITTAEYPLPAQRPANSELDSARCSRARSASGRGRGPRKTDASRARLPRQSGAQHVA
jgi:dTDP-4-dehydrorhamnose reductase